MKSLCILATLLAACLLFASAHAHPHGHHHHHHSHHKDADFSLYEQLMNPDLFVQDENRMDFQDYHPRKLAPYHANETVYYSYHIHVYFMVQNANQTAAASALRDQFIKLFDVQACGGDCQTWCPNICHWELNMQPMGPHPIGSFGFYVPLPLMLQAQNFISINHGDLIVLIHPNSGYPIVDHSLNSFWIKQVLPLDLSQLDPYDPPNSTATRY